MSNPKAASAIHEVRRRVTFSLSIDFIGQLPSHRRHRLCIPQHPLLIAGVGRRDWARGQLPAISSRSLGHPCCQWLVGLFPSMKNVPGTRTLTACAPHSSIRHDVVTQPYGSYTYTFSWACTSAPRRYADVG